MTIQLDKIPATVVTGFLGSGKTTLLSNIIREAKGRRLAIIVNEFGELDIDSEVLRSCPIDDNCDVDCEKSTTPLEKGEDGIYELPNGCICCTVEEEFLPVMKQIVERRADIDHILIETSGLALPKPLVQAFNWPEIKQHCTVDAVITVLDGPAVAAGRYASDESKVTAQRLADDSLDHEPSLKELLHDQLTVADLVVVSKNDLLNDTEKSAVSALVKGQVNHSVKTLFIDNGQASLAEVLGIEAASEDKVNTIFNHHDHHHQHGHEHDHAHDYFDSFVISVGQVDADKLQQTITTLLQNHTIYRIKGFVALPNKPMRQVLQAVGKRFDSYFDRPWRADETRQTQLVFIGKHLSKTTIENALQAIQA